MSSSSCLVVVLLTFSQDRCSLSFGVTAPRLSPGTGGRAEMSPVAPPVLAQDKVVVGGGAHGIKYIGFVGDLELWGRKTNDLIRCCIFPQPTSVSFPTFLRITRRATFRNVFILNLFRKECWHNWRQWGVWVVFQLGVYTFWKHYLVLRVIWITVYYRSCQ